MGTTFSGPMFERDDAGPWKSSSGKQGAHYNLYWCRLAEDAMDALHEMFPDGKANSLNFVLFSTSGVHGTYSTIEDAEADIARGNKDEDGEDCTPEVTFLIVHPRIVCQRYGNCLPKTADDIAFLKQLRASSWAAVTEIGKHGA